MNTKVIFMSKSASLVNYAFASIMVLLSGCQNTAPELKQRSPLDAIAPVVASHHSLEGWLQSALAHSPTYNQAQERLLQASLVAEDRLAGRLPELRLSMEHSRRANTSITTSNNLNVVFNWELDWLGKLNNSEQQALYSLEQAKHNKFVTEQTVLEQVSLAYISAVQAKTLLSLYETRARVLAQQLSMLEENYQLGLTNALDVYSARSNLASEQSRIVNQKLVLKQALNQLQVIAGQQPQPMITDLVLFSVPASSVSELSSDLLLARPDVNAAWFELLAVNQAVAVAFKAQFPSFKLSSTGGYAADEFKSLLKGDFLWSWTVGLTQPLFEGGRLANALAREQSNERIALSKLQDTLNKAYSELDIELARLTMLSERVALAQIAFDNAQAAQSLSFSQYQKGLVTFTTVLDAQKRALDAEVTLIGLKNEQLSQVIEFEVALGRPLTQLFSLTLENQNEF
jgi:multidrug efflux system outer membrane protein